MSVEKMVLVQAVDMRVSLTQAVMYEKTAAKYVMLGIHEFRKLVDQGIISFRTRHGHSRRIYLKSDLDAYLAGLPVGGRMSAGEDLSSPEEKGAWFGKCQN